MSILRNPLFLGKVFMTPNVLYTPSKSPFLVNPRTMQIMLNEGKANKPGRDTRTCSSRGTILSSRHMKPRYRKFKANLSLNHRPLTDIQYRSNGDQEILDENMGFGQQYA